MNSSRTVKTTTHAVVDEKVMPMSQKFAIASSDSRAKLEAALKLSSGTRKLRDHELSYFGVNLSNSSSSAKIMSTHRHLANAQMGVAPSIATDDIKSRSLEKKWSMMESDKPDLLRHSPANIQKTGNGYITSAVADTKPDDGPIYENLRKPSALQRREDYERDERILTELSQAADQILSVIPHLKLNLLKINIIKFLKLGCHWLYR